MRCVSCKLNAEEERDWCFQPIVSVLTGLRREAARVAKAEEVRHQRHRFHDGQDPAVRGQGEEDHRAPRPRLLQGKKKNARSQIQQLGIVLQPFFCSCLLYCAGEHTRIY